MAVSISCQQATRFIEERAEARLPLISAVALTVHLWYCPLCKRYAVQSPLLAQLALFAARQAAEQTNIRLPEAVRARMQQRLNLAISQPSDPSPDMV